MTGKVWDDARVGSIELRVTFLDGQMLGGVPASPAADPDSAAEIDDTGYARYVWFEDRRVDLAEVREVTIVRPDAPG